MGIFSTTVLSREVSSHSNYLALSQSLSTRLINDAIYDAIYDATMTALMTYFGGVGTR
jgi:hypothetical protein